MPTGMAQNHRIVVGDSAECRMCGHALDGTRRDLAPFFLMPTASFNPLVRRRTLDGIFYHRHNLVPALNLGEIENCLRPTEASVVPMTLNETWKCKSAC